MNRKTLVEINNDIVDYINYNETHNEIPYYESIRVFKDLLKEIEHEFEENDTNMVCCICGKAKDIDGKDEYESSMCYECYKKEYNVKDDE